LEGQDFIRVDDWRATPHYEFQTEWVGVTVFRFRGSYPAELQKDEESLEAKEASGLQSPTEPSHPERVRHNLTHYPFREWCTHCVMGKGRTSQHRTQKSHLPVVQFDFTHPKFFTWSEMTILTGIDVTSGMVCASQLPPKKPTPHSVGLVKNFLLEIGRTAAILQCDNEPAIKLLLQRVVADMGLLKLQYAAPYSSASMGSAERFHASLQGQARTLLSDLEEKTGLKATGESPITSWAIRHASWLQTRFMTHAAGKKTSYFRRWQRDYTNAICGDRNIYSAAAAHCTRSCRALE